MKPEDQNPHKPIDPECLRAAYQKMSADVIREAEAAEWCESFIKDGLDSLDDE
jgi:hypothetical protein